MKKIITLVAIILSGFSFAQLSVSSTAKVVPVSGSGAFTGSYTASSGDTYKFKLSSVAALDAGWTATLSVGSTNADISSSETIDSVSAAISASGSQAFVLAISAGTVANKNATIVIDVYNTAGTKVSTQKVSMYAHPTSLLIEKSGLPFFLLTDFGSNPVIKMNSNSELTYMDTTGFNKSNIDHIVINQSIYGASVVFNAIEIENLTHYLQTGGKIFISGQDIASDTVSVAQANFLRNYLGVTPPASTATGSSWTLDPIASTEFVFGGIAASALNIGAYAAMKPDVLTPTGANAVPVLQYNATQNAAIRNNSSNSNGWRTVYVGFRYEAVQSGQFRTDFLDRALEWLDGTIDGIEFNELANKMLIGQNYPNPATGITSIPFGNITSDITLKISDLQGKTLITTKIPAYSESVKVDVSILNNGIYLYQIADKNNVYPAKMMNVVH